jgi:hypothetical protein
MLASHYARSVARRRSNPLLFVLWAGLTCACTAVTTVDLLPEKVNAAGFSGQAGSRNTVAAGGRNHAGGTTAVGNAGAETLVAAGTAGSFAGLRLVNRYEFSGTGTTIIDSVSGKNGEAMNGASLDGSGQLTLEGAATNQYVRLPAGLLSPLTSATLVAFFTWHGGPAWQSLFNFGATSSGAPAEDPNVLAQFFFTPLTVPGPGPSLHLNVDYHAISSASIDGKDAFPSDLPTVVVAVVDGVLHQLRLYINGTMISLPTSTGMLLTHLKDTNAWLGQSEWAHDVAGSGNIRGTYDEFRIYSGVMTNEQIATLTDPSQLP